MNRPMRGFTVLELLIIISVIGILAAIGTVGWTGLQAWSRDRAREQDTRQWASTFDLYKSRFAVYPVLPEQNGQVFENKVCLGTFENSDSKCMKKDSLLGLESITANDAAATSMFTEVKKVSSVPVNNGPVVKDTYAGPFFYSYRTPDTGTQIKVYARFINFFETNCPSGFQPETSFSPSPINPLSSVLSSDGVKACSIVKDYTFDPGS